ATGTICATGTLGQVIPPSIVLVLLGDTLSIAYSQAQLQQGIFTPKTVSVGDLFVGALLPGLILVALYCLYLLLLGRRNISPGPVAAATRPSLARVLRSLVPPLVLIAAVLGSILGGIATPTEAAGVGALGACLLALLNHQLSVERLREVVLATTRITAMVFMILIGAAVFSLVF